VVMLENHEFAQVQQAIEGYIDTLAEIGIIVRVRRDFDLYVATRRALGDTHLNQAFDPAFTRFKPSDFWLHAQNQDGKLIATYCMRRLVVDDFYGLVRSQALWFGTPQKTDRHFIVDCDIAPFGGVVSHGGGLWVREDHRGAWRRPRLSTILPRLGCAIGLRDAPFDHESAMILVDPHCPIELVEQKATSLGIGAYRFTRARPLVKGWFPPEGREATVFLCHSTRAEALASLTVSSLSITARSERVELRNLPFIDQNQQLVHPSAIGGERQQHPRIGHPVPILGAPK
jgi:hypothetical protein